MENQRLGNIIKERRHFLNITQKQLSEVVGIGLRSLVDIENGKGNPTLNHLKKLVEILGLRIEITIK